MAAVISAGGPAFTDKRPIEEYESTSGQVFGASAAQQADRFNIFANAMRQIEGVAGGLRALAGEEAFLTKDQAKAEAEKRGVVWNDESEMVSQTEFDIVTSLKERERRRESVMARRPKTWTAWSAQMAGGVTGSFADPVNIAASLIPVVGQARYALWLERAGSATSRLGVRAGVGALSGAVGSAALEPFQLAQQSAMGFEYGLQDAFLNVAFGTVMGGGLHAIGGAVADRFVTPERSAAANAPDAIKRAALAEAVAALDEGRAVDATPMFRRDDSGMDRGFLARELNRAIDIPEPELRAAVDEVRFVRGDAVAPKQRTLLAAIKDAGGVRLTDANGQVTPEGGDVRAIFNGKYPPGVVNNKSGLTVDYVRERLEQDGWFPGREGQTTTQDVLDLLDQSRSREVVHPDDAAMSSRMDRKQAAEELKAAGVRPSDPDDVAGFKLAQHRAQQKMLDEMGSGFDDPPIRPDTYDPETGYEPPDITRTRADADHMAARANDEAEIDGEIEALDEMLGMARTRGTMTPDDEAIMALADEFNRKNEIRGRAVQAAAACILGVA